MKSAMNVAIERAVLDSGNDVYDFLDSVMEAVKAKLDLFGAVEIWDLCPEELHLEWVVVENHRSDKYYLATLATNEEGEVSVTSVVEVRKQWATMDEPAASEGTIQRSAQKIYGLSDAVVKEVARKAPSFWSGILG